MRLLKHLFEQNRRWADGVKAREPDFFATLAKQQAPRYFWIGCSDSRVPANQIVGLLPGEVFVHRNVANLVVHTDLNCLSALQFAVEVLKVEHVIVCGHYGCGGVRAALGQAQLGLIDNWLRNVRDVKHRHRREIDALPEESARVDKLCEHNVMQQVANVCHTTIVQNAWGRGQKLAVHGWIYRLEEGLLHDLEVCVEGAEQIAACYRLPAPD